MLAELTSAAAARGESAWLVGGAVRDLLLVRPTTDLDVVVGGTDAAALAAALGKRLGAAPRMHARFGTATLELPPPADLRIDVARPRRETYAHPGALPDVSFPATLEEDLARRDFSIQAMALPLSTRGPLVDPFGGRADLAARRVRALHPRSFVDDPTRAYRAARYAARLGFRIDPGTARWIRGAVAAGAWRAVSGDRLFRELSLILEEPDRARAAAIVARLGLDAAITPALARPGVPARLRAVAAAASRLGIPPPARDPLCYLLGWMGDASASELLETADRLALSGRARQAWLDWPGTRARGEGIAHASAGERIRRVRGVSPGDAAAVAATLDPRDRSGWIAAIRAPRVELTIRGRDLVAAGVPSGPRVGEALARTLEAREEGRIGAQEELEFAIAAARELSRVRS